MCDTYKLGCYQFFSKNLGALVHQWFSTFFKFGNINDHLKEPKNLKCDFGFFPGNPVNILGIRAENNVVHY